MNEQRCAHSNVKVRQQVCTPDADRVAATQVLAP